MKNNLLDVQKGAENVFERLKYLLKKYYPLLIMAIGIMVGITLIVVPLTETLTENLTLKYFMIVQFLGYLFFILSFVEIMFVKFLLAGFDPLTLSFLAIILGTAAQAIDYGIGYLFSNNVIERVIGRKRYENSKHKIEKYGNLTIFLFNLFPLSSPVLITVAGMLKYNFRKVMVYSFLGLTIKYVSIALFIKFFIM